MQSISISIVVYRSDPTVLKQTLQHLAGALGHCNRHLLLPRARLTLVDNGPDPHVHGRLKALTREVFSSVPVMLEFMHGHGNIGYGKGHNLAFFSSDCAFHLILNPDVFMAENALTHALKFMAGHGDTGLLVPRCFHDNGTPQLLIKDYPSLATLLVRGLFPYFEKNPLFIRLFHRRLGAYCRSGEDWNEPRQLKTEMVSGCFMFFRHAHLCRAGGFSHAFFLYFEDYDLSMRMHDMAEISYDPRVVITHLGGNTSKKGGRHILYFIRSAVTFFSRHGWRLV